MRYYVYPQRIQQKTINFTEDQTHHMRKVLRLKPGDKVECFDENGNVYIVEVKKLSKDGSFGTILETESHDLNQKRFVTILQSFPSALPKLDLVIEKGTEIGVDNFVFFKSKRSEMLAKPSEEKVNRWKKIAIKASEQSQRFTVPQIHCIENINEIDFDQYDGKFILYEKSENLSWPENLKDLKNIIAIIGPEGGFEEIEVSDFNKLGFIDIKPFKNILRTETAAIATAVLLQ